MGSFKNIINKIGFIAVKKGQVYRAIKDVKMLGMVILKAAGSGGFYCTIPKGTRLVIENNPVIFSSAVGAIPLNYKELEEVLVPKEEMASDKYNFYGLIVNFKDLKRYFILEESSEIKFDDTHQQERWDKYC
jgi:hypothetical protein